MQKFVPQKTSAREFPRTKDNKEALDEEIVRINLNVPKRVRAAWKSAAIRSDTTLTELIVECVESCLRK